MVANQDVATSLEQLLENLIKMVAKNNQHADNLHQRVNQLEWVVREMKSRECSPLSSHEPTVRKSSSKRFEVTI